MLAKAHRVGRAIGDGEVDMAIDGDDRGKDERARGRRLRVFVEASEQCHQINVVYGAASASVH